MWKIMTGRPALAMLLVAAILAGTFLAVLIAPIFVTMAQPEVTSQYIFEDKGTYTTSNYDYYTAWGDGAKQALTDPFAGRSNAEGTDYQKWEADGGYLKVVTRDAGARKPYAWELFKKTISAVPKDASGNQIKAQNFQLEADVKLYTGENSHLGAVGFGFRDRDVGHWVAGNTWVQNDARIFVLLNTKGVWMVDPATHKAIENGTHPEKTATYKQIYGTPFFTSTGGAYANLYEPWQKEGVTTISEAHVTIKAVDGTVTLKVTSLDGAVVYFEKQMSTEWVQSGGFTMGAMSATGSGFGNVKIKSLDVPPVEYDFEDKGTYTTSNYDYYTAWGDGAKQALTDPFAGRSNAEGTDYQKWEADGGYLKVVTRDAGARKPYAWELFKKTISAVPKDASGNQIKAQNFRLEADVKLYTGENSHLGAVGFGFRDRDVGHWVAGNTWVQNDARIFVLLNTKGVWMVDPATHKAIENGTHPEKTATYKQIYGTPFFTSTGGAYANLYEPWQKEGVTTISEAHVIIEAVDGTVTLKVTSLDGAVVYFEKQMSTEWVQSGGFTMGAMSATGSGFGNVKIKVLDANIGGGDGSEEVVYDFEDKGNYTTSNYHYYTSWIDGVKQALTDPFAGRSDAEGTDYQKWQVSNGYLLAETRDKGANKPYAWEMYKKTISAVPKDNSGKEISVQNFELVADVKLYNGENPHLGGVAIGFRDQNVGYWTPGANQIQLDGRAFVMLNSKGVFMADPTVLRAITNGEAEKSATSQQIYGTPFFTSTGGAYASVYEPWQVPANGVSEVRVYLTVKDLKISLKITSLTGGTTYFEKEMTTFHLQSGGFTFAALGATGHGFGNVKIKVLEDSKEIKITEIVTPPMTEVTIDRAAGETLDALTKGKLKVKDANGTAFEVPYALENDTYRSYKDGHFVFDAKMQLPVGVTVAEGLKYEVPVYNKIGTAFDTETTVQYYFDHPNDLLDFNAYYSQPDFGGENGKFSAYDGSLIQTDVANRWKLANGKLTANYGSSLGNYAHKKRFQDVATLVMKEEMGLNLKNYRIEFDYTSRSDYWYNALLLGVQNPEQFYITYDAEKDFYVSNAKEGGSGLWVIQTYEGAIGLQGGIAGSEAKGNSMFFNSDGYLRGREEEMEYSGYFSNWAENRNKQHKMTIEVVNGGIRMWMDDSSYYYAELDECAMGGLLGFSAQGENGTFDNLKITALDVNGNEISLDSAEKGWRPKFVIDTSFEFWNPFKDEWFFEWGKEYEK